MIADQREMTQMWPLYAHLLQNKARSEEKPSERVGTRKRIREDREMKRLLTYHPPNLCVYKDLPELIRHPAPLNAT